MIYFISHLMFPNVVFRCYFTWPFIIKFKINSLYTTVSILCGMTGRIIYKINFHLLRWLRDQHKNSSNREKMKTISTVILFIWVPATLNSNRVSKKKNAKKNFYACRPIWQLKLYNFVTNIYLFFFFKGKEKS